MNFKLINVISLTALNLNALGNPGLYDYLLYSFLLSGMVCLFTWNLPPKYGFNRWVLTLNVPFSGCVTSAPPYRKTWATMNGPDHLDFNFPGKSLSRELNKRTCCPTLNSFLAICLSCQAFVFSLYMQAFS